MGFTLNLRDHCSLLFIITGIALAIIMNLWRYSEAKDTLRVTRSFAFLDQTAFSEVHRQVMTL